MSMVLHLFPTVAVDLGIAADRHGLLLASMRAVVIAMSFAMAATRFRRLRLSAALARQLVAVLGLILAAMASSPGLVLLGLLGVAQLSGYNHVASHCYSTGGSIEARRGAATGMHEATLSAGLAAGAAVGGLSGHWLGARAPYPLAAAVIVALAGVQWVVCRRRLGPGRAGAGVECLARGGLGAPLDAQSEIGVGARRCRPQGGLPARRGAATSSGLGAASPERSRSPRPWNQHAGSVRNWPAPRW